MTRFEKMAGYPDEIQGRFNSFITTQFDDSLSVEMQIRSLIKWITSSRELINDIVDYINLFIEMFDERLQEEIVEHLNEWLADGTLTQIINNDVFDMKADKIFVDSEIERLEQELEHVDNDLKDRISNVDNDLKDRISNVDNTLTDSINVVSNRVDDNKNSQDNAIANIQTQVTNMKSEVGSNEYGHWIKRADGTMECWTTFTLEGEPKGKWGELFYWEPEPNDIWLPQMFIDLPTITYAHGGSHFLWGQTVTLDRVWSVTGYRGHDAPFDPVTVTLRASGRWSESADGNFDPGEGLPSYWNSHLDTKIANIKTLDSKTNTYSFVFITDTHVDTNDKNSFELVRNVVNETGIDNVILGGDLVSNPAITPKETVIRQIRQNINSLASLPKPTMMTMGNHDDNGASMRWVHTIQPSEQYDVMFKQMEGSVNFGSGHKRYYYRDDTVNIVRYIVLDSIDIPYIQEGTGLKYNGMYDYAFRQEQIDWLSNVALNTPSDYSVIVSSHTPPYKEGVKAWDIPTFNEELVRGVLGAYKNKSIYSGSSSTNVPFELRSNISVDFTSGGGEVVAWLCGHVHYDNVVQLPEGFPLITVLNDGGTRWLDSPKRVSGTITEQAFDVVTVNKSERKIYMTRVGAGEDRVVSY